MTSSADLQTPARRGFLARVRAEELPQRFTWHARDWVALLSVPAIFLSGWLVSLITTDRPTLAVADTGLRIAIFVVLVVAYRKLLGRHWRAFWAAPWRSVGLVLLGMVVIQVVVGVLGGVLRPLVPEASAPADTQPAVPLAFGLVLFASLGPVVTALIEDTTFRHTLLMKFPVWNRFLLAAVVTVVNALIFGAIHINNFQGQWLLTLSYAGAGLLMNLVYLWTRNIWHVLLMHGLNNFILGGPVTVVIAQLLGIPSS